VEFYFPEKSIALAGFEPTTFGSSGKHTNHYTMKATPLPLVKYDAGAAKRQFCTLF
jgi:hypothetical protein